MAVSSATARPERSGRPTWSWVAIARMELRMGWRSAAFRVTALGFLALGFAAGDVAGKGVGYSAYSVAESAWRYLGLLTVIWMSLAAVRETSMRTDVLISSKPQPNESLAATKFIGAFVPLLVVLFAMFFGAMLAKLFHYGGVFALDAYALEYVRIAGVLFFAAAASFTLALIFDTPIAGSLVGLYWVMTMAGKSFLAKFYFPSYTQNLAGFVLLGLALLCLAFWLHKRRRRGAIPPAAWVRIGTPIFFALAAYGIWSVIRDGHDPQAIQHPVMDQISAQEGADGYRAPGFVLPDQNGKPTGLTDFEGKVLVIALWSPHDPDSVLLLDRLNEVQAQFAKHGVQAMAICIGEDTGAARTFARGERLSYPVVEDWGTYNAPVKADISPVATAYRTTLPPRVVVTDRRRYIRSSLNGSDCYDGANLEQLVLARIGAEPR